MWVLKCMIILPGFTVLRLSRAVAFRLKKNMKNSSGKRDGQE